jgi:organic radical activating enzyme
MPVKERSMLKILRKLITRITTKNGFVEEFLGLLKNRWMSADFFYTCDWLHSGLTFFPTKIHVCCVQTIDLYKFPDNSQPLGEIVENIIEWRKRRISCNKAKIPPVCRDCVHLRLSYLRDISSSYFLEYAVLNSTFNCNFTCTYCGQVPERGEMGGYDIYPVLEQLYDKNLVSPNLNVTIAGGEPTIMKNFDNILNLIMTRSSNPTITVFSNMYLKSDPLKKYINSGQIHLLCSIDAASRDTFKTIKNVDGFEKVWCNLNELTYKKNVTLKMILLDENYTEVEQFVKLAISNGFKKICIDVDQTDSHDDYPDYIVEAALDFANFCKKKNITPIFGGNIYVRGKSVKKILQQNRFIAT